MAANYSSKLNILVCTGCIWCQTIGIRWWFEMSLNAIFNLEMFLLFFCCVATLHSPSSFSLDMSDRPATLPLFTVDSGEEEHQRPLLSAHSLRPPSERQEPMINASPSMTGCLCSHYANGENTENKLVRSITYVYAIQRGRRLTHNSDSNSQQKDKYAWTGRALTLILSTHTHTVSPRCSSTDIKHTPVDM